MRVVRFACADVMQVWVLVPCSEHELVHTVVVFPVLIW
jgi:hypothetical protein